jgi:hypothetical protein
VKTALQRPKYRCTSPQIGAEKPRRGLKLNKRTTFSASCLSRAIKAHKVRGFRKLTSFARAGLPILFVGHIPSHAYDLPDAARNPQAVPVAMRNLRDLKNVYFATDLAGAVSSLNSAVNPDIRFQSRALLLCLEADWKFECVFSAQRVGCGGAPRSRV